MFNSYLMQENLIRKRFLNKFNKNNKVIVIDKENYTKSFGYQWKLNAKTQLDSYTKTNISKKRFLQNTNWNFNELKNKNILEIGSGAGRFTELLIKCKCNLFTVDSSDAIYVNYRNNFLKRKKLFFIKANIERLPFLKKKFDYIFCYGVIQHTRNPYKTLKELIN